MARQSPRGWVEHPTPNWGNARENHRGTPTANPVAKDRRSYTEKKGREFHSRRHCAKAGLDEAGGQDRNDAGGNK